MKNIRILLISILILMMYALSANAFYFYGNTLNASSTLNVSNTNVTVEVYKMVSGQGPVLNTSNSSLSNADGFFNVSVPDIQEDNIMCKIKIKHFISGTEDIDLIGPSLPELPSQEIQQLSPINFYMRDGAAINITAVNFSGGATVFNYMIKDKKLGYPIESDWSNYHSAVTVYLPADRNYSIMIFPNQSFPVSYDLNNASDYDNNHADIVFNVSEQWKRVSGYALAGNSSPNADDITIISYLIEPGNMLFQDHPIPYNLSAWDCGAGGCGTDEYNATTGFYNITLPGAAMGANIMMFATVRNGTDYYGA
ncbi:MAG: hypothetical protein KAU20_04270, partial [Nanoarchaeota archaeon]|nr:hypothetical protein [Nanoarchaeota archaeon]